MTTDQTITPFAAAVYTADTGDRDNALDYLEGIHVKHGYFIRLAGTETNIGTYTQQSALRP
jgi:hypothetical protein